MKIHSDLLRHELFYAARLGNLWRPTYGHSRHLDDRFSIMPDGVMPTVFEKGSKSHERAFNVYLVGNSSHRPNSSADWAYNEKAATWDEWGVFLARVYEMDPYAVCGTVKNPVYESAEHYHWVTAGRFKHLEMPADTHAQHKWGWDGQVVTGAYLVHSCTKCSASQRRMSHGRRFEEIS